MQTSQTEPRKPSTAVSPLIAVLSAIAVTTIFSAALLIGLIQMSGALKTVVVATALLLILAGVVFSISELKRLGRAAAH